MTWPLLFLTPSRTWPPWQRVHHTPWLYKTYIMSLSLHPYHPVFRALCTLACHILCLISCCSKLICKDSAGRLVNPQLLNMCSHWRAGLRGRRLIMKDTPPQMGDLLFFLPALHRKVWWNGGPNTLRKCQSHIYLLKEIWILIVKY